MLIFYKTWVLSNLTYFTSTSTYLFIESITQSVTIFSIPHFRTFSKHLTKFIVCFVKDLLWCMIFMNVKLCSFEDTMRHKDLKNFFFRAF